MLPPLHNLSLTTVDSGVKRKKRDETVVLGTQKERYQLDWSNDKRNWQELVCRVWDGRPLKQYVWDLSSVPYMSPDGNWKNRELVASSQVQTDASGDASCTVLKNIHGFDPTGVHNMDMELLNKKLDVHYPATPMPNSDPSLSAAARTFAFSSLPGSNATRHDIQAWAEGLSREGFAPWWTNDGAFQGWKANVRSERVAYELVATNTEEAGKIEYPMLGQTYIGETQKHQGRVVPHGMGFLKFKDGSIWRGRWLHGFRASYEIGAFTDPDGNITLGTWPPGHVHIQSTTAMAQEELHEWNDSHAKSTVWTDSVLVEKPGYGRIAVASAKVGVVLRMANWHTETAIARMMGTTNPFELGYGRDTDGYLQKPHAYTKLLPLAVFDVDYTNSYVLQDWERYQYALETQLKSDLARETESAWRESRMQQACPDDGFFFRKDRIYVESNLASLGVPLRKETNEQFLLHAIKPESLFAILNNSFDMSFGGRGLFGGGIYFADDPGKSDQYATPTPINSEICERLGLNRPGIRRVLEGQSVYPRRVQSRKDALIARAKQKMDDAKAMMDEDDSEELDIDDYLSEDSEKDDDYDVFFMLVSRVPLGLVASLDTIDRFQMNKLPKKDRRKKMPLMSDAKQEGDDDWDMSKAKELAEPYSSLACKGGLRYREYVVYKNAVARVSHVIAYARARQRTLLQRPPATVFGKPTWYFSDKDRETLLDQDDTKSSYRTASEPNKALYVDPYAAEPDSDGESTDEEV
jgi:hypothetical protein